jgi:hypothetical protein
VPTNVDACFHFYSVSQRCYPHSTITYLYSQIVKTFVPDRKPHRDPPCFFNTVIFFPSLSFIFNSIRIFCFRSQFSSHKIMEYCLLWIPKEKGTLTIESPKYPKGRHRKVGPKNKLVWPSAQVHSSNPQASFILSVSALVYSRCIASSGLLLFSRIVHFEMYVLNPTPSCPHIAPRDFPVPRIYSDETRDRPLLVSPSLLCGQIPNPYPLISSPSLPHQYIPATPPNVA